MRTLKRFSTLLSEVGVFLLGLIGSEALAFLAGVMSGSSNVAGAAFYAGFLMSGLGLFLYRRKTRAWKISYDAEGYLISKAERESYPVRAKLKRLLGRTLIWAPSAIAAFVLFFFPVASHLLFPTSHSLPQFHVPIPWSATVFGSPYRGLYWIQAYVGSTDIAGIGDHTFSSLMSFSTRTEIETIDYGFGRDPVWMGGPHSARRDFRIGDLVLSCWQYPARRKPLWAVECQTPASVKNRNLYASFFGQQSDLSIFYHVVEGIRPIE